MRPELQGLPEPQWFHHGVQILDLLDQHKPKMCVELGTHKGGSAIAVARIVRKWDGVVHCIDTWSNGVSILECADNVNQAKLAEHICLYCERSDDAACEWDRGSIDYLYVDAGHTFAECKQDLDLWWPFLRVGGLIAGDDYDDPHGMPAEGVTAAWDAFEQEQKQQFERTVSTELLGCQCEKCQVSRLIWGVKRA